MGADRQRVDAEMEEKIKALEEKVDYRLTQLAESVSSLTASVRELVERDIRKDAADERQQEINQDIDKRLRETEKKLHEMQIQRATESQGRQWIHKHWPLISVVIPALTAMAGFLARGWFK